MLLELGVGIFHCSLGEICNCTVMYKLSLLLKGKQGGEKEKNN